MLEFCRRADAFGFDSLWVISKLFHRNHLAHPMTMLAYAAAVTRRIGLGAAVDLLNIRHPVEMAQQAATLNALSGERLTLGISQGGRDSDYAESKQGGGGTGAESRDLLRARLPHGPDRMRHAR